MENIPYPSNYFDPYGDEVHCPICDACMVQSSDGDWECLQYHEEDLISQKSYAKNSVCPVCESKLIDVLDEANLDWVPDRVEVVCVCQKCRATWKEVYVFSVYEMIGEK